MSPTYYRNNINPTGPLVEIKPTGPASGDPRKDDVEPQPAGEYPSQAMAESKVGKLSGWFKNVSIPKTILGLLLIAVGIRYDNDTLINGGIALAGVGVSSKAIKWAQGKDPLEHEKKLLHIPLASGGGVWEKVKQVAQKRKDKGNA